MALILRECEHENDTYAGTLVTLVTITLDTADGEIKTNHDLARVLLSASDAPLR